MGGAGGVRVQSWGGARGGAGCRGGRKGGAQGVQEVLGAGLGGCKGGCWGCGGRVRACARWVWGCRGGLGAGPCVAQRLGVQRLRGLPRVPPLLAQPRGVQPRAGAGQAGGPGPVFGGPSPGLTLSVQVLPGSPRPGGLCRGAGSLPSPGMGTEPPHWGGSGPPATIEVPMRPGLPEGSGSGPGCSQRRSRAGALGADLRLLFSNLA